MENLNKGEEKQQWGALKKVSAALTTITLAPFLFPPLIIFSTIAFALASPLLLYFTSYVCTNKILSSLLPLPVAQQLYKDKEWVEEDEEHKEEHKEEDEGDYGNIEIEGDEDKEKEGGKSNVEMESKEEEGEEAKPKKKGKGKKSSGSKKT